MKARYRKQKIILIEVQYEREFDFLQRILPSSTKTITEHPAKSDLYKHVIKMISINILYFDLGHGKDYIYHGKSQHFGNALPC